MSGTRSPDVWVLTESVSTQSALMKGLCASLEKRRDNGQLTYTLVFIDDIVITLRNGSLGLYVKGVEQATLPTVVYVNLAFEDNVHTHAIHAVRHLETMGVHCVNGSKALLVNQDNFHQLRLASGAGIPVPESATYSSHAHTGVPTLIDTPTGIEFPVVLKSATGAYGNRVMLLPTKDTAQDIAHSLRDDGVYILQKYIKACHARSFRVQVIGRRVVQMWEISNRNHTRIQSNVSQGGSASSIAVNPALAKTALRVAGILGLEMGGLDFLEDADGRMLFLEANACPSRADLFDIEDLVDYLVGSQSGDCCINDDVNGK